MTSIIVHHIPALSGDCFLIEPDNGKCILIDCGYASTYRDELKSLLVRLNGKGCRVALMIITHIDDDHIGGAIPLIQDNGDAGNPQIIPIDNIWFNGLYDLCTGSPALCSHIVKELPEESDYRVSMLHKQMIRLIGSGDGWISATKSESFEKLCASFHYHVNDTMAGESIDLDGCSVRVLSPGMKEIKSFENWIDTNLVQQLGGNYKLQNDNFLEFVIDMVMILGREDESYVESQYISAVTESPDDWINTSSLAEMNSVNRASIVVDIRYKGISLLFTGDSESMDWIEKADKNYDLVKISHHGTTKPNLALLNHIHMSKAVISANGSKGHPEKELLARLIKNGVNDIYFDYDVRQKENLLAWQIRYGCTVHFCEREIML